MVGEQRDGVGRVQIDGDVPGTWWEYKGKVRGKHGSSDEQGKSGGGSVMDMGSGGRYDAESFFDTGSFEVKCDPALYGTGEISLDYRMYSEFGPEDLSGILCFVQENYRRAYARVLEGVLSAYRKNPKWDVWIEEARDFQRIDFVEKEELHPYLGIPDVELAFCYGRTFWGLTFPGGTNKLSFEHGFCAVFEREKILAIADNDFPIVLQWWDYYCADGNILKDSGGGS